MGLAEGLNGIAARFDERSGEEPATTDLNHLERFEYPTRCGWSSTQPRSAAKMRLRVARLGGIVFRMFIGRANFTESGGSTL